MKSLTLIHTSWLKPFADFFARRRVSLLPYFEEAKIEPDQVTGGDSWITKRQLYRFLNALAAGEKMSEVGFLVGETIKPDLLGGISVEMSDAKTLGEAIRIFCRLINRSTEENRAWLEEGEGGDVWIFDRTTNPFRADRRIADHTGLMSMVNLVRLSGGADWYPKRATLQTRATSAYLKIEGLRRCEFQFNQTATGFSFPAAWLLYRVDLKSPSSGATVGVDLLDEEENFGVKIKRLLRAILGVGGIAPSVGLMAELCGTSARTLHRRLNEEGSSYRSILDEVRVERAKARLREEGSSVKELAYDLGYSGSNNFIRAFRRLTGMTPEQFRGGRTS